MPDQTSTTAPHALVTPRARAASLGACLLVSALAAPACALEPGDDGLALEAAAPGPTHDDALAPIDGDAPLSALELDTFHNWYTGGPRGAEQGTHGLIFPGDCPAGSAVVGVQYFEGGNSDWVDSIGVACWGPSTGYVFHNWYSGGARGAEQGTHGTGFGLCPWGSVVNGLQYFDGAPGDAIDGVGVQCDTSPVTRNNWFPTQVTSEQGNYSPALGVCPSGRVVVGVQVFEGTSIFPDDWTDAIDRKSVV
jgi:hypothetical protein